MQGVLHAIIIVFVTDGLSQWIRVFPTQHLVQPPYASTSNKLGQPYGIWATACPS